MVSQGRSEEGKVLREDTVTLGSEDNRNCTKERPIQEPYVGQRVSVIERVSLWEESDGGGKGWVVPVGGGAMFTGGTGRVGD